MNTKPLDYFSLDKGKTWVSKIDDVVVYKGKSPIFGACRKAVEDGLLSPDDYVTVRDGEGQVVFISQHVGKLIKLAVHENANKGPTIVKYRPYGETNGEDQD